MGNEQQRPDGQEKTIIVEHVPDPEPEWAEVPGYRLTGFASDIGKRRKLDEDAVLVIEASSAYKGTARKRVLLLVADGVGGHSKGDVASNRAAFFVGQRVYPALVEAQPMRKQDYQKLFQEAIARANADLLDFAAKNQESQGMGTTIAMAVLDATDLYVANIGDSRVYLITPNSITQVTKDHSYVQELVDKGELTPEAARDHPKRNVITRAVGFYGVVNPDFFALKVKANDQVLVCCDGLPVHVSDDEIAGIVRESVDPQEACRKLIALANSRGGSDNISVALAPAIASWP